jgi:hypothetical protein
MNGYDYICNTTTGDSYIFTVNYGSTPSGGAAEDIQSVSFPDPASYYHVYHYVGTAPSGNIADNYGGACVTPSYNVNNSYISTAYISLPVVGTGNNPTQVFGAYASDGVTARVSCPDSIPLYYGISGTSSLPGTNTSFAYVYSGSVPLNWGITGAYIGYNSNDYTYISSADNDPGTADSYSHLNDLQTFLQLEQMPMTVSYTTPVGSGDGVTSTIDSATATSGSFIDVGYSPSGYASIAES